MASCSGRKICSAMQSSTSRRQTAAQPLHHVDVRLTRIESAIAAGRQVNTQLFLRVLARPHVIGARARLKAQPALHATFIIQGQLQGRFVAHNRRAGNLGHPLERRHHTQGVGQQLIVIAPIRIVEPEHDVERLAVERSDRERVGHDIQHACMLFERFVDRGGVHVARAHAARLHGRPPIAAPIFLLFQNVLPALARVEIPHPRIVLLHLLKEMQHAFAGLRQVHFRVQIHVDVVVIAQRVQVTHGHGSLVHIARSVFREHPSELRVSHRLSIGCCSSGCQRGQPRGGLPILGRSADYDQHVRCGAAADHAHFRGGTPCPDRSPQSL